MRRPAVTAAAIRAAHAILEFDPTPGEILTESSLLELGGLPGDAPVTAREFVEHRTRFLAFRQRLSHELRDRAGRHLHHLGGGEYLLLTRQASAPAIERTARRRTETVLYAELRALRQLPPHLENPEDRQRVTDAVASKGAFLGVYRRSERRFDLADPRNAITTTFRDRNKDRTK